MTLPFNNDRSRKYQCFVCGVQYDTYEEYKAHIIKDHEQGRDYIRCPLNHCDAPVRDLRAHFRAKHPKLEIPKVGMMRAIVWKDFSGGKKKTKKPKFKEGYYQSTKMNKPLHYRSGYECSIYECLDHDTDVTSFDVEPFKIPYVHKGKQHEYVPDLIVRFLDGRTEVWEVKPSDQTTLEVNQDKWEAAKRACANRGWGFEVMTEVGIQKLKNKIKGQSKQMASFFDKQDDNDDLPAQPYDD